MFDDPRKELKQMENELLLSEQDSQWLDRELAEAHRLLGDSVDETPVQPAAQPQIRNFANGYGTPAPADRYDYEDDVEEAPDNELSRRRTIRNLAVIVLLELAGILGIVAYWAVKLL